MKDCIAKNKQWPDASADVSPGSMNDFLAHADVCPYHKEILRMEEDEFRLLFHRARGLDPSGRILRGAELERAIAEQEERAEVWEASCAADSSFGLISLYNGDQVIASCGAFLDLTNHESSHDLDPHKGLQIRARCGGDDDREVVIGFHALVGKGLDGKERLLPLGNGYTVRLGVRKMSARHFQINFSCVENDTIEEKGAEGARPRAFARGAAARGGASSFSPPPPSRFPPPIIRPSAAQGWFAPAARWVGDALVFLVGLFLCATTFNLFLSRLGQSKPVKQPAEHASTGDPQASGEAQSQAPLTAALPGTPPAAAPAPAADPSAHVKGSTASRVKAGGRPADTERVSASREGAGAAALPIRPPSVIWSSKYLAGSEVDTKHSVSDPALADKVLKALSERSRVAEIAEAEGSDARRPDYQTFWRRTLPEDGKEEVRLVVEVCPWAGDGVSMTREVITVSGPDYETAASNAVEKFYECLNTLMELSRRGVVSDALTASTPAPVPPRKDPHLDDAENKAEDAVID